MQNSARTCSHCWGSDLPACQETHLASCLSLDMWNYIFRYGMQPDVVYWGNVLGPVVFAATRAFHHARSHNFQSLHLQIYEALHIFLEYIVMWFPVKFCSYLRPSPGLGPAALARARAFDPAHCMIGGDPTFMQWTGSPLILERSPLLFFFSLLGGTPITWAWYFHPRRSNIFHSFIVEYWIYYFSFEGLVSYYLLWIYWRTCIRCRSFISQSMHCIVFWLVPVNMNLEYSRPLFPVTALNFEQKESSCQKQRLSVFDYWRTGELLMFLFQNNLTLFVVKVCSGLQPWLEQHLSSSPSQDIVALIMFWKYSQMLSLVTLCSGTNSFAGTSSPVQYLTGYVDS